MHSPVSKCFFCCIARVCAAEFTVVSNGKIVVGLSPEPFEAAELEAMKFELPCPMLQVRYMPTEAELAAAFESGKTLASMLKEKINNQ